MKSVKNMTKLKERVFQDIAMFLGSEFSKYLIEHPTVGDQIPENAVIVFRIKGNEEFNGWMRKVAESVREAEQPIVTVDVEKFKQPSSSISKLKVEVLEREHN